MTKKPRIVDISELGLKDRDLDTKLFAEHQEVVRSFMEVLDKPQSGIELATLESFETIGFEVKDFVHNAFYKIKAAVTSGNVFDFGVTPDAMVKKWAQQAEQTPIAILPWSGRAAVFFATHPGEVPFEKSMSIYLLESIHNQSLQLTELMFVAPTKKLLIFGGLVAQLPFGVTLCAEVNAFSGTPNVDSVGSILNPCLMGAAFLASDTGGGTT